MNNRMVAILRLLRIMGGMPVKEFRDIYGQSAVKLENDGYVTVNNGKMTVSQKGIRWTKPF